jgi:hypothetical protein
MQKDDRANVGLMCGKSVEDYIDVKAALIIVNSSMCEKLAPQTNEIEIKQYNTIQIQYNTNQNKTKKNKKKQTTRIKTHHFEMHLILVSYLMILHNIKLHLEHIYIKYLLECNLPRAFQTL